jgi:hypothetical protein
MPEYTTGNSARCPELPKATQDYLVHGAPVGNRDNALFAAACQMRDCGYLQSDIESVLIDRAIKDGFSEQYARKKILSAYSRPARERPHGANSATSYPNHEPPKSSSNPQPQPLPAPIADGFKTFLETCFRQGEGVAIGKGRREAGELKIDGGDVLRRERWLTKGKPPLNKAGEGIFVRINPIRSGGKEDKDVTAYRHYLVEFDEDKNGKPVPKEIQFSILINSGFPIAAISFSGNVSLQALVIVDAADRKEFDRRGATVRQYFSQFDGFDAKNKKTLPDGAGCRERPAGSRVAPRELKNYSPLV